MLLAATLALGLNTAGAVQAPVEWTALTEKLVRAANEGALDDLKSARAGALRAVVTPPSGVSAAMAHYTLAYADYRLAADDRVGAAEQRDFADEAEQHLREALRLDDRFADAYGLLSSTLGLKISWAASVDAKMSMGPESGAALSRALSLEPDNPRLLIISGLGLLRRPVEYGGDPKQAEALFRRAATMLDGAGEAAWPNWGRFDAHVWLGQALARRGDAAGARDEYTRALAIAPGSSWVKDRLLPALGK
jgi:tetratricopeptide (TPR) repeat protein